MEAGTGVLVGRRCGGRCWRVGVEGAEVGDNRYGCWGRVGLAVVGSIAGREVGREMVEAVEGKIVVL